MLNVPEEERLRPPRRSNSKVLVSIERRCGFVAVLLSSRCKSRHMKIVVGGTFKDGPTFPGLPQLRSLRSKGRRLIGERAQNQTLFQAGQVNKTVLLQLIAMPWQTTGVSVSRSVSALMVLSTGFNLSA